MPEVCVFLGDQPELQLRFSQHLRVSCVKQMPTIIEDAEGCFLILEPGLDRFLRYGF